MSQIEHYRDLYEHEKDCNLKMLLMIASVPESSRGDSRFQQALNLAAHLAACRENWLDRMAGEGSNQTAWFEEQADVTTLAPRFAALEAKWTDYLATLDDAQMAKDFDFPSRDGGRFGFRIEVQVIQLIGHANYHRGQVALLVDQLGGETVDTDYLYWAVHK